MPQIKSLSPGAQMSVSLERNKISHIKSFDTLACMFQGTVASCNPTMPSDAAEQDAYGCFESGAFERPVGESRHAIIDRRKPANKSPKSAPVKPPFSKSASAPGMTMMSCEETSGKQGNCSGPVERDADAKDAGVRDCAESAGEDVGHRSDDLGRGNANRASLKDVRNRPAYALASNVSSIDFEATHTDGDWTVEEALQSPSLKSGPFRQRSGAKKFRDSDRPRSASAPTSPSASDSSSDVFPTVNGRADIDEQTWSLIPRRHRTRRLPMFFRRWTPEPISTDNLDRQSLGGIGLSFRCFSDVQRSSRYRWTILIARRRSVPVIWVANGVNPGVETVWLLWPSEARVVLGRLLSVTDVSTTCTVVIFRVNEVISWGTVDHMGRPWWADMTPRKYAFLPVSSIFNQRLLHIITNSREVFVAEEHLTSCWEKIYVLFSQPGESSADTFSARRGRHEFFPGRFCLTKKDGALITFIILYLSYYLSLFYVCQEECVLRADISKNSCRWLLLIARLHVR